MDIIDERHEDGIVTRRFDLQVAGETVPGLQWFPADVDGQRPTICIAHGGFQHKNHGNVPELAIQLVGNLGVGVVALDAPQHGDRIVDPEAAERARTAAIGAARSGGRRAVDPEVFAAMRERAVIHVAEWRALLDELQQDQRWAAGPFGWWGVSMGTTHGIPMISGDSRISAAVLGLNALRPDDETMAAQAAAITVPLLFLNQSDDELMTREAALALFDAFGSAEKTMHINPGRHVEVPRFERDSSELFFRRHLLDSAG
jgi:hypothetical protein